MKGKIGARSQDEDNTQIVVGMATCGIAAGARPVLNKFADLMDEKKPEHVVLKQTGCIGMCEYEPIVEVFEPGKEKVTYIQVNPAKAEEIFNKHIVGGNIVSNYTIGKLDI